MRLLSFSVTNFRSITTAHKIDLHEMTVLVGKNNEGKSNLLMALNVAMNLVIRHGIGSRAPAGLKVNRIYEWERDFPLQFQNRKRGLESIFTLVFELNENEIQELHRLTGIRGNEIITVKIKIGRNNEPIIDVPKRGSSSYNKNKAKIAKFISSHISVNYIGAIRTEGMAKRELQNVISSELSSLNSNDEYVKALEVIDNLEQEILDSIAKQLHDPLKSFLPSLKNVSIKRDPNQYANQYQPYFFRDDIDVVIDDGLATSISNKGDGIKSLVTLAILKDRRRIDGASVIAIEEPESHLHPGAIHGLVDVVNKISENNQVIITTHNPLFVQQNRLSSNVIVDGGTARVAKTIAEIRDVLGVLPSDNLINARHVIIVEGEDDKLILDRILPFYSERIKKGLRNNTLVIKALGGAGNLLHELTDLRNSLCKCVVLLDNDKAGIEAGEKAMNKGLLKPSEIKYTICNGSKESEIEDCIRPDLYKQILLDEFRINIKTKEFHTSEKWSVRMRNTCLNQGVRWSEKLEERIKRAVAESIPEHISNIDNVLIPEKSGFIKAFADLTDNMIDDE